MAELLIVLDRRLNIETPVHAACATDPQRFETRRPLEERDDWAKSCGVCNGSLR